MLNVKVWAPATSCDDAFDPIEAALIRLGDEGLAVAPTVLNALADAGFAADHERMQLVIIDILSRLLDALDSEPTSAGTRTCLSGLHPEIATIGSNLLIAANFPDGGGDLSELPDATVLCIAGLAHIAGQQAVALDLLRQAQAQRPLPAFSTATYAMRCWMLGIESSIAALWSGAPESAPDMIDQARRDLDDRPLDLSAHHRLARGLAEAGQFDKALAAFMTALALPVGQSEKLDLGSDFAIFATYLRACRLDALLDNARVRFALTACPKVTAHAEAMLAERDAEGTLAAPGPDAVADVRGYLRGFIQNQTGPYPVRDDKPHVDVVWLEITNFCNQKCTFCPDMYREDARTWLPLAEIKRIIDELADTISVGSMQLNAYGEPLLHPNIAEILTYIRDKKLAWPTFFTSHGLTLVDKKLEQLSHNYPAGIAISLHNDSQESYEATRSAKIGDYETLVARVTALMRQMAAEGAASHLRLYQMVCNGHEDKEVDPKVRGAFPGTAERMIAHVRKWEAIAADIAAALPPGSGAHPYVNSDEYITQAFSEASHGDKNHLPILGWRDENGHMQHAFMSARPVGTYANLLLEYHPKWTVERKLLNHRTCGFVASPSLAIFATGKLGICCLDMNSTATFGSLSDYGSLRQALSSIEAKQMFAQLSNGVATGRGCQICLGTGQQQCGQ
jgi:uncharacterized radical SAM superfamily Fe-S cluster-containing enzyme